MHCLEIALRLKRQLATKPESRTFEIADFEDRCPRLCGCTLQLGTMDLYEALRVQILPEEGSNGRLQLEDSLVCLSLDLNILDLWNVEKS